jgi:hypothetical protein
MTALKFVTLASLSGAYRLGRGRWLNNRRVRVRLNDHWFTPTIVVITVFMAACGGGAPPLPEG